MVCVWKSLCVIHCPHSSSRQRQWIKVWKLLSVTTDQVLPLGRLMLALQGQFSRSKLGINIKVNLIWCPYFSLSIWSFLQVTVLFPMKCWCLFTRSLNRQIQLQYSKMSSPHKPIAIFFNLQNTKLQVSCDMKRK